MFSGKVRKNNPNSGAGCTELVEQLSSLPPAEEGCGTHGDLITRLGLARFNNSEPEAG